MCGIDHCCYKIILNKAVGIVIQMRQQDFKTTILFEKNITNRKINGIGEKVEWLNSSGYYL